MIGLVGMWFYSGVFGFVVCGVLVCGVGCIGVGSVLIMLFVLFGLGCVLLCDMNGIGVLVMYIVIIMVIVKLMIKFSIRFRNVLFCCEWVWEDCVLCVMLIFLEVFDYKSVM